MLYSSVSPLEVLVPQYSTSHPLDVSDYRTVRYRAVREHTNVVLPHLTPAQQHLVSVFAICMQSLPDTTVDDMLARIDPHGRFAAVRAEFDAPEATDA